jgi:2'-deoxynucleoside 5'-phosphate N-hydrolase
VNIYFSCSITGGRKYEHNYQQIILFLINHGHTVPTAHLASEDILDLEKVVSAREVFERDMRWIEHCDKVIAEVSTPSHGVGYEIAVSLNLDKPVLCIHEKGVKVSKMITGNSHPNLLVREYTTSDEALVIIQSFLA